MTKIPEKPEDIYKEYTQDLQQLFGNDLESVITYGSAARGEYVPKKSDINFIIILSDEGIERFTAAHDFVRKWEKRNVSIPLFLTKEYIANSLDSFPIEFLNITAHYKLVYGKDVFENVDIDRDNLRLQLEREMKGKLLNLRQAYFQAAGNAKMAALFIHDSFGTFLSLFPAVLYLKNESISSQSINNIKRISELFNLDEKILERLYRVKQGMEKPNKSESIELLRNYIAQIRSLAIQTDAL